MANVQHLFVADYVPLANKGEEAIVRGIEDLLREGDRPVELAVFGQVAAPDQQENIAVFPRRWAYPDFGAPRLPGSLRVCRAVDRRLRQWLERRFIRQLAHGNLAMLANMATSTDPCHAALRRFFDAADCVLAGHDGVFGYPHCGVLRAAKRAGKRTGILGAGGPGFLADDPTILAIYRAAINDADFFVVRERTAYERMAALWGATTKLVLAPDPAFAMAPAPRSVVEQFLASQPWWQQARRDQRPIVGVTVCHKNCLLQRPFASGRTTMERVQLHERYLATCFDAFRRQTGAELLFLPHSLEGGFRNDVAASHGVVARMAEAKADVTVLTEDLPARLLKGIISQCDFFIGERAHSLIGAAAVTTPFVALTASDDHRTHEILGDMCGCNAQMLDMDQRPPAEAAAAAVAAMAHAAALRQHLSSTMAEFRVRLAAVRDLVRGTTATTANAAP